MESSHRLMHRKEAVSQSLTALINENVEEAVAISSNYYGSAGTLYEKETISIIQLILEHDFTPDPAIKSEVLKPLRVVAAAMELWGAGDVREFAELSGDWTYKLQPESVIQLLYAAGLERHRLDQMRRCGVAKVVVRTLGKNPGPACREVAGKLFPVEKAPVLPHRDPACQCSYGAPRTAAE